MINYIVIEGTHTNPNEISTIDEKTKKEYGPFINKNEAPHVAPIASIKNQSVKFDLFIM